MCCLRQITQGAVPALAFALLLFTSRGSWTLAEPPDFNREIRPLLSDKCFKCHGPDAEARKAELRLDRRQDAMDAGAVVSGRPEESALLQRITSDDPDQRMPPVGDRLSAKEIGTLRAWIESGAKFAPHWSYQRPVISARPEVQHKSWPSSEIDYFVLAQIEKAGLTPARRATPAVLLRRLYLDLIGISPPVEQVLDFEANPSPQNYQAHVERLLKSSHFGEKWAAGWLDLARYADSNGYQHDDLRTMWPYRDWVIQAFNDDMPFDRFTVEQLAGDLLPDPTTSQLVATGFNRNVPVNFSGGTKVAEIRAHILHDRVATTGAVWLGLTVECAQCHDHKFDAVSQREYYQLYAYFNQAIGEVAQKSDTMFKKLFVGREVVVYESGSDQEKAAELGRSLVEAEGQLAGAKSGPAGDEPDQGAAILDFEGTDPVGTNSTSHPAETTPIHDTPVGGGESAAKTVVDSTAGADGFFGTAFSFPLRDFSEFTSISFWIKTDIPGSLNFQVHAGDKRVSVFGVSVSAGKLGAWTKFSASRSSFSKPPWATHSVDWSKVSKIQVTAFGNGPYDGKYIMLDQVAGTQPSERAMRLQRVAEIREQIAALQTSTMVMQDAVNPPATHVMIRGDYTTPGERVETGVLGTLHPLDPTLPRNRLGLAQWLVAPENPLTARVTVNRIWAEIFGRGIVNTPEDFGMQGEMPSHPQLLDWLAVRFVEEGWSVKKLIKLVVLSATYQQASAVSEKLMSKDFANGLHARGPRFRLSAELVRDNLLSVAGLLSKKIGGPVVYPVQPAGLWEEILNVTDMKEYPTSMGDDRHRRGIYTVWRRGNPYPSMVNFDSPDRSVCTAKRDRSNTPLQALTLLNDPVYVEMATKFAATIWSWNGSEREKVIRAFRTAVARQPSDEEVMILLELRRKRGSWFAVAQALLNLDETITKS